jgi:hypothetical protein
MNEMQVKRAAEIRRKFAKGDIDALRLLRDLGMLHLGDVAMVVQIKRAYKERDAELQPRE